MPYLRGLKEARARRFMTMRDLAEKAGMSTTTIVKLESLRQEARMSTARKLAEALGATPQELLGEQPDAGQLEAAA